MVAPPPFRFVAATLTGLCLSTTAWADAAGDAAVAAMDAAVNRAVTLVFDYQVDNQEPDKPLRVLAVKLQTNGASKLYEFTAPPDIKGTKVLTLSPTQMYVYLPAFREGAADRQPYPRSRFPRARLQPGRSRDLIIWRTVGRPDRLADSGSICARADGQRRAERNLRQDRDDGRQGPHGPASTQILQRRGRQHQDRNPFEL